ncbi:MAG: helix-turn-helix domain-containing protein [Verrucomicrobiae bacterium]|nr:helix-turn-helix domain-containing protein [Verrucomicrobiae bacterium]
MSVAKSLSEEQVAQIQRWADEGAGLSEIQRRLNDEMGVKVTYMEVRFLIDDLKIQLKPEEPPKPEEEDDEEEDGAPDSEKQENPKELVGVEPEPVGDGQVTVTISELQRPGAIVSGRVTFANGKGADWWMDQMGRLGMNADDPDYRPNENDMLGFQQELQRVAREKGF